MNIKILNDEIVFDGKFIQTIRRHFIDREGKERLWEMVKRKTHGRIVAIAAVTPKQELILTKIFRVPFKAYVLELPAGLRDKKGEQEAELAKRELLEETGYRVDDVELLTAGPFNAGLLADEIAIYYGTNARFVQSPQLEGAEDIEVVKIPLGKLVSFLANPPDNLKVDVKLSAVLPFLERRNLL